jgi:hypothetical protein
MAHVERQHEEVEFNWIDLVDAWRAQAWERAYAAHPRRNIGPSPARRRDTEVEHRRDTEQQP